MRRFWLAAAAITTVAFAAVWLADQPGRITVDAGDYRLETASAVGVLLLLALVVLGAVGFGLWRWIITMPRRVRYARERRMRTRGELMLSRGMVAVAAGDRTAALRFARQVESLLPGNPLAVLLSAQSAQLAGDEEATRRHYAAMLGKAETEFLGLRGLAMQAHRLGQHDEALNLARRAYRLNPGTPWVLGVLFELEAAAGHWREVERVTERAVRAGLVNEAEGRRRRAIALFAQARAAQAKSDAAEAERLALAAHRMAPAFVPGALLAAALAAAHGRNRAADEILATAWAHAPHDGLAESFLNLHLADDPGRRLARAERLTASNGDHPESRLLLARTALTAGKPERVRDLLGPIARDSRDGRVIDLLAETEVASVGRTSRRRPPAAVAPAAWRCTACGHRHDAWRAHCQQCRAFDTLAWVPPLVGEPDHGDRRAAVAPADEFAAGAEPVVRGALTIEGEAKPVGR
jgi:HemY protein